MSGARLWRSIERINQIGATPAGGVCRQALTDEDRDARDLFVRWCREAECAVCVDRAGNVFARRAGREPDRSPVLIGSHLDTQPTGGRFDGIYGVIAGLEIVRTLNDQRIETVAPIEIVSWTNEEGCRFAPSMAGSGVFAGLMTLDDVLARRDRAGAVFGDELVRIGYAGVVPAGGRTVAAYFEAHIEQGPVLEAEEATIGVVLGGQGKRSYDVTLRGQEAHAGTTPMPRRHDPMKAAALVICAVERIAHEHGPDAVTTVGAMEVRPGSRNTIPREVYFTVDLRHPDAGVLDEIDAAFRAALDEAAGTHVVEAALALASGYPPVRFDPGCVAAVRDAARALGLSHRDIVSGAGHDACHMARVAPAGMVFVPCENGISHAEIENATPEDLAAGCDVLLHAALRYAGIG